MTVHPNGSDSVVPHQSIEIKNTSTDAILKALSTVLNENRRKKVFSEIKQLKACEYSKDTYLSSNYYIYVIFISTLPPSLTSCILVKTIRQRDSNVSALSIERLHWKSRTG